MYQKTRNCFATSMTLSLAAMVWTAFHMGCAPKNLPTYNTDIIEKRSHEQPQPLWQYPETSVLREAGRSAGLNGVVRQQPVPGYLGFMQDVEPPFIIGMHVLADGSIVCISPVELQQEFKRFVFGNYCREIFPRVKVTLLEGEGGTQRWSQVLDAGGLHEIQEINATLLLHSRQFDKDGKFVEAQLIALNTRMGGILWKRRFTQPFRHFSIAKEHDLVVFYTEPDDGSTGNGTVEAVHVPTGDTNWKFVTGVSGTDNKDKAAWPIMFSNGIILFDKGVTHCRLQDGRILWNRADLVAEGIAQPEASGTAVFLQSKEGLVALDVDSGKTLWTSNAFKDDVTKLIYSGKHLCVSESEKGWFSDTWTLSMMDPDTGAILWKYETEPIPGNVVENESTVFFSTKDRLIALSTKDGRERYKGKLPWDEEFSSHRIVLRNDAVVVGNEWNVAMWGQRNGKMTYHHHFEPLCPIMTTEERMKEQRELGGQVSAVTAGSLSYNSAVNTAHYTSNFYESMANYRSTGNTLYLNDAHMNYGMARASMGMERTMAGLQFGLALSQATMNIGMSILKAKINTVHSMVYPAIDTTIQSFRAFDNAEYAVRLVGIQDGKQRFSAIEILNISTGEVGRMLLSPYQMPPDLKTLGSAFSAHEISGYLPVSIYQHHTFETAVDLQRKRVYHYGPGLHGKDYVYYGKSGFIRGALRAYPINLPADH